MNKVIRMTEEIWNLPAGHVAITNADGAHCALGKIGLALGMSKEDLYAGHPYTVFDRLIGKGDSCQKVYTINDKIGKDGGFSVSNHELAIRTGIEMLLAAGCTLETDDTVSRELARIKSCAEVV